jgi:fatty acid desaturase
MQTYLKSQINPQDGERLFRSLQQEAQDQKLLTPAPAYSAVKATVLLIALLGCMMGAWLSTTGWESFGWSFLLALVLAQFAFLGHDAGHASISARNSVNRFFGQICMTFVTGLAFQEWSGRHREHHQHCQFEEKDADMHVDYVVSLTRKALERKSPFGKLLSRLQFWTMPFLSLFFGQSQRHLSQLAVFQNPRKFKMDFSVLVFHFLFWLAVPTLVFQVSFLWALWIYVLPLFILGPYLASIFWVNHIGMPLIENPQEFSFLEHQVVTSRNIRSPKGLVWLFGGLNLQIEHHLFPKIPSHRISKLQPLVTHYVQAAKLPYNAVTWPQAFHSIMRHLRWVSSDNQLRNNRIPKA